MSPTTVGPLKVMPLLRKRSNAEEELRDLLTYKCTHTGVLRCPPFSEELPGFG